MSLGVSLVAALGCLPWSYDATSYRLPRLLYWWSAHHWFWIGTLDHRLDFSSCGFEWQMLPVILLTRSDRLIFLLSFLPFLLMQGLVFFSFRALGVNGRSARRWMWLLPPVFLLWANLHGGFIMGFVVLSAYCAESLWLRLRGKPGAGEGRLWGVAIACVPAAFCNPNGFLAVWVLAAYRQSNLQNTLYEWQKPPLWPPTFLNLLLLGAVSVLVWQRRRTRAVDWLLLGLFGAAYLTALRNTNLLGMVAPMLIASLVPWKRILPAWTEWAAALVLLGALAVPFARGRAFQMRDAEWKYPAGAAGFSDNWRKKCET